MYRKGVYSVFPQGESRAMNNMSMSLANLLIDAIDNGDEYPSEARSSNSKSIRGD